MNTSFVLGQQLSDLWRQGGEDDWANVSALLNAKEYKNVIDILQQKRAAANRSGDMALVGMLSAALQLCLTCMQYQIDIEERRQSLTRALDRERELRQQIGNILGLTEASALPAHMDNPVGVGLPERQPLQTAVTRSDSAPSFWQRMQSLLGKDADSNTLASKPAAPPPPVTAVPEKIEPPNLSVYCLGTFRVYVNGCLVENWSGNKSKSIFKHMVVHRGRPANHEVLMDIFWPGEEPEAARRNLYQAIYMIRQALQQTADDPPTIVCQDSAYSLNPALSLWVDSTAFEEHYRRGQFEERQGNLETAVQAYEKADNLYDGDFLAEDIYEEWLLVHRERLKHAHINLLDRLSQYHWTVNQYNMCIHYCLKILEDDNCREDIYRRLMLAYLHQGQRHLALRQYQRCVDALFTELGIQPEAETVELYQQLVRNEVQMNGR